MATAGGRVTGLLETCCSATPNVRVAGLTSFLGISLSEIVYGYVPPLSALKANVTVPWNEDQDSVNPPRLYDRQRIFVASRLITKQKILVGPFADQRVVVKWQSMSVRQSCEQRFFSGSCFCNIDADPNLPSLGCRSLYKGNQTSFSTDSV
jgi:hypothetical protein